MTKNIYQFSCNDASGETVDLSSYKGKALLIVNTASKCGFTPQYEGLEKLQQDYSSEEFSVLAFPCNQFGAQEPGSNEEITEFWFPVQGSYMEYSNLKENKDTFHF